MKGFEKGTLLTYKVVRMAKKRIKGKREKIGNKNAKRK